GKSLVVVEAEDRLAAHQTGNNSGVIHSGLYYKPGSLKAKNCVQGREELYRFCAEHGVACERCGKIVVATDPAEVPALEEIERRGRANGLIGLERLTGEQLKEHEPHVAGVAGLFVPETGIADYVQVTETYARLAAEHGAQVRTQWTFTGCERRADGLVLQTSHGPLHASHLI